VIAWDRSVEDRFLYNEGWVVKDFDGEVLNKVELDHKMYQEGVEIIKKHPVLFVTTGLIRWMRLAGPTNHRSMEIMGLFMNAHNNLPDVAKIVIILTIRCVWLLFLVLVAIAMWVHRKEGFSWEIMAIIILYYNAMYSIFTQAEARYLLTVMPFYFIFFIEGLRLFSTRYKFLKPLFAQ
jgi:hypothetical protein